MKKRGLYDKLAKIYDLIDYPSELAYYQSMRKEWISTLENETILEFGVGTGKNLKYYKESNTVIGIDREIQMLLQAKKKIKSNKIKCKNIILLHQDKLPWNLPIAKFTTILATFVFCTMDNPKPILDELLKWTVQGSKLVFFEYVVPKDGKLRTLMRMINPITVKLFGVNFFRKPTHYYLDENWNVNKITHIVPNWIIVVEAVRS